MTSYATESDLASFLRIDDSAEAAEMGMMLESASRLIDSVCGWSFDTEASSASARVFAANNPALLDVDPIGSATGLVVKHDSNGDGTFDITWASTDYQTEPLNQRRAGLSTFPFVVLRAIDNWTWPVDKQARVQVTAQWGWADGAPAPVRDACILIAKDLHSERNTLSGVAFGDGVVAYMKAVTPRVRLMLAPYTKVHI